MSTHAVRTMAATAALVLAWIWPFAGGPSSAILPWLASAACLSVWLLVVAGREPDVAHHAARGWLIAAVISSVIGMLQFFGASTDFRPWINVTALGDAFGNLRQRNQFATLTGLGLAALLWGPLAGGRPWQQPPAPGAVADASAAVAPSVVVTLMLLSAADAASSSRTGLAQLVALALLALVWRAPARPGIGWRLAVVFAAYATASVALPLLAGLDPWNSGIAGRFGDADRSCGSRRLLWANVLHLIAQKPWSGWGWRELDFAHFITAYPGERFCDILDNAHNLPLHLAVELGVPFALLVCGLMGWLVWRARPWREADDTRRLAWAVLALIGLHSLLEYPLWYGPFQIAVVLAVWVLWQMPARFAAPAQGPRCAVIPGAALRRPLPASVAVWVNSAAIAVLCAVAYAAWDYHRISQIYREPEQRALAYRDDTLAKIRGSWLFRDQVRFAELTLARVTPQNAADINRTAHAMLHFSPEARVVEKIVDSALLLGKRDEAVFFMRRMRIAYPQDYAHWRDTRDPLTDLPVLEP